MGTHTDRLIVTYDHTRYDRLAGSVFDGTVARYGII